MLTTKFIYSEEMMIYFKYNHQQEYNKHTLHKANLNRKY